MKKRGQLSVFIIIGIIIIISALLIGYSVSYSNKGQDIKKTYPEIIPIYDTINDCIKQRSLDSLRIIGFQGGYINLPRQSLETIDGEIAYGLYNNKNILISKNEVAKEIADYIDKTAFFCINKNDFEGYSFEFSEAKSEVKINKNEVNVKVDFPITVKKDEKVILLKEPYLINLLIPLGDMLNTAKLIIDKQIKDGEYVSLTFLSKFDYVILFSYEGENIVYSIIYNDKLNPADRYYFRFAAKNG